MTQNGKAPVAVGDIVKEYKVNCVQPRQSKSHLSLTQGKRMLQLDSSAGKAILSLLFDFLRCTGYKPSETSTTSNLGTSGHSGNWADTDALHRKICDHI